MIDDEGNYNPFTSGENPENDGNGDESENQNGGGGESGGTTDEPKESQIGDETTNEPEKIRLVYIGPSLMFEKLRSSQILYGTEQEIQDFMAPITEKYPEAAYLLVTLENLTDAMKKVESKTSILHKYYHDMLAKSRDNRR